MDKTTAQAVAKCIVNNHDENNLVIQWFGRKLLLEPQTISYIVDYLHLNGVAFESKIITNGCLYSTSLKKLIEGFEKSQL